MTNNTKVMDELQIAELKLKLGNRFKILSYTYDDGHQWAMLAISGDCVPLCGVTPEQYLYNYNNPIA